jgi:hypothetical protein
MQVSGVMVPSMFGGLANGYPISAKIGVYFVRSTGWLLRLFASGNWRLARAGGFIHEKRLIAHIQGRPTVRLVRAGVLVISRHAPTSLQSRLLRYFCLLLFNHPGNP